MENSSETSSSSHLFNVSTAYNMPSSSSNQDPQAIVEILSLNKLSQNLEKLLADSGSGCNYNDAEVVVEGIPIGIHRCILATRSEFFSDLFKDGKSRYIMSDLLPYGNVGYETFLVFLSYLYTGKLKSSPPEVSTCVDGRCSHDACWPAISFAVELAYASSVFKVPEMVSLCQRRLVSLVDKAVVEDLIPILDMAFHCQLEYVLSQCIDRLARSDLDNISLEKELPPEVAEKVKLLRSNSIDDYARMVEAEGALHAKKMKSIYKALDHDDIEKAKSLLCESGITLDEAFALHYVVAYCDIEFAKKVIDLNLGNVNLRNSRGYTVLHIAAMRKDPSIIISLLSKGADASDTTIHMQSAATICRRLTRPKDFHSKNEHVRKTSKDRVCIDVLERGTKRNPMIGNVPVSSSSSSAEDDDLYVKSLHLENRVAFARLLFPMEVKLATEMAHAQTASEFPGLVASNANLTEIDSSKRLLLKVEELSRTVEMGRCYFPHCWEVINKLMEDNMQDLFDCDEATAEEQEIRRTRVYELQEDVQRASNKDMSELYSALSVLYSPPTRLKKSQRHSWLMCFFQ